MKGRDEAAIAIVGAGVGFVARDRFGLSTGNTYLDFGIGFIGAVLSHFFLDYDGFGDFVEGLFGGYAFSALV
ncbi:MAG: hypothetical protein QXH07_04180 [Thermoplasmata archaeon]